MQEEQEKEVIERMEREIKDINHKWLVNVNKDLNCTGWDGARGMDRVRHDKHAKQNKHDKILSAVKVLTVQSCRPMKPVNREGVKQTRSVSRG